MRYLIKLRNCQANFSIRKASTFVKFVEYIELRRSQAEKSLLIQISHPSSAEQLRSYLVSNFGPLQHIHHYSLPAKGKNSSSVKCVPQGGEYHWILAEFVENQDFHKAYKDCQYSDGSAPYQSSMCWFSEKNEVSLKAKAKSSKQISIEKTGDSLSSLPYTKMSKFGEDVNFKKTKSLSEQLKILENSVKLTELGIRMRFLVAHQLEKCVEKFFPIGCILPFGSSISGIGRQGGDLDLVLLPDKREVLSCKESSIKNISSLYYQSKFSTNTNSASNNRFHVQRVMETVADVIQLFMPGCTHVQRILQARIPILRFWSDYTDLQCDLSMTNASGVHMSELIYLMCSLEERFPTLLFAVRSWASARKITNSVPGRQPTNFMFVLLLIYFLQHKTILPTLDVLFNNPAHDDYRTTSDGIDCTFLRDRDKILKLFTPQKKNETLAQLLFQFFEFYSNFDFQSKGVSVLTGNSWGKADSSPMYIQNPLERHHNVSRNVSHEEVSRFKNECFSALWKLETSHSAENSSSIRELLLTPQLEKSVENRLKIKELLRE